MRLLLALIALLTPGPVLACAPLFSSPTAIAEQVEAYWGRIKAAQGIVFGVVERDIFSDRPTGVLRVTHVYFGPFEAGQTLPMVHVVPPWPCANWTPVPWHQEQGASGVVVLAPPHDGGIFSFAGFLGPNEITRLLDERAIRSAREQSGVEQNPAQTGTAP